MDNTTMQLGLLLETAKTQQQLIEALLEKLKGGCLTNGKIKYASEQSYFSNASALSTLPSAPICISSER
jgi:hypothetical protein